jgi:4-hydroxy-tetrahydrodipicolinate synthase
VVLDHYRAIGDAIRIPLVVQDYPPGTGTTLTPDLIARLFESVERFHYLKLEDAPAPLKIAQVRERLGSRLPIFGGLGGLYFLEELDQGACGSMAGFAYPDLLSAVWQAHTAGQPEAAARLFYRYLPLVRFEYQPYIALAIRTEILRRRLCPPVAQHARSGHRRSTDRAAGAPGPRPGCRALSAVSLPLTTPACQ